MDEILNMILVNQLVIMWACIALLIMVDKKLR